MSPGSRRNRLMMSPFVKSLINNNLVSVRDKIQGNILSLEDSKAENVIPRIPTPQFQSNVIGTLMRSQSNLSFVFLGYAASR